jgi:hypothetical protein
MTGVEIGFGTLAFIGILVVGAGIVGRMTERHIVLGVAAFAAFIAALILAAIGYGWAVRTWL